MRLPDFFKNNNRLFFRWILISLLVAFLVLSCIVLFLPLELLDIEISEDVQEIQTPLLSKIMIGISWLGRTYVAIVVVLSTSLVALLAGYKREAVLILSTLLAGLLGLVFKILINRPRPTEDLVVLLEETKYQSFPSGHVLFYTAFFGAFILIILQSVKVTYKIKLLMIFLCISMIFLCAFSRIYLGAHWFTDVLGGFILGIFSVTIMGYFYIKDYKENPKRSI